MWHDRRNMGIGVKHITDLKSLRDWLNALLLPDEERQRIATGLATRATLRVLPLDWAFTLRISARSKTPSKDPTISEVLQRNFSSAVDTTKTPQKLKPELHFPSTPQQLSSP